MTRTAVDAVLLDAGGVLVLPHHDVVVEHGLGALGLVPTPGDLDRAHYESARTLLAIPDGDDQPVWVEWSRAYFRALGVDADDTHVDTLMAAFRRSDMWTRPAPGALEGLRAIAATGVRIAIVSNAEGHAEAELARIGMCQVGDGHGVTVDVVVDSAVVGVAKPHPRIFEIALDHLAVDPARAVHVGDIIGTDIAGARAAGVHPLHYDPYALCADDDHEHVASLADVAAWVTGDRR